MSAPNGNQPAAAIPDPQVVPKAGKAKRRKISASDKQRILETVGPGPTEPGAVGRILRREGIYHSQLSKWRQQRVAGISASLGGQKRAGPKAQAPNRCSKRTTNYNASVSACASS